ncbi:MAG: UDP-N-acetylmuramate dehydrogenase [Dysgonamonadaceae bacterium]|nr:UDP-N-acetylmuramate dehydrogenase [Dysgonamonadaceae bacterium]
MKIKENYSLLAHNTFGLDVKTRWFAEYESEEDLARFVSDTFFRSQQSCPVGQGSNLLFLDDFIGIIVHSAIRNVSVLKEDADWVYIQSGAGVVWDHLVAYCVQNGWGGIENLSLIPGEVGAAAVQNIGAYGSEIQDAIVEVHAFSLEKNQKVIFHRSECEFGYRESFFKKEPNKGRFYVTYVVFRFSKHPNFNLEYGNLKEVLHGKTITLQSVREAVIAIRQHKLPDPKLMGNAGSFFKNPYLCIAHLQGLRKAYPDMPFYPVNDEVVKVPAAWLIDQCGMKGATVGGAAIFERQPLVIVNKGGATGNDIAQLAEKVKTAVKQKFGVELRPEVNYI